MDAKCLDEIDMFFSVKDEESLVVYNKIWTRDSNLMKKEFDSEPVSNKKYFQAKIKSYNNKKIHIFMVMECLKKVLIMLACW